MKRVKKSRKKNNNSWRQVFKTAVTMATVLVIFFYFTADTYCQPFIPDINIGIGEAENPQEVASSIQILLILTVLALAPSILIMMTSFTRTIIVLSFLRNAIGTQQMPPNQVLIGLALFLTLFVMMPVGQDINDNALKPYTEGELSLEEALDQTGGIIKNFMLRQCKEERDLAFFSSMSGIDPSQVHPEDLPLRVVIPAFIINELTIAFKIGFLIFIPFLIIDMVVSSTLMSMGMLMLPPIMISLPFKILLFIMVRGWSLVTQTIIGSFN